MILPYLKNPRASIRINNKHIIIRSKKYKITKYLFVQFITCLDKEMYGHNSKEKLKKHTNEWTDKLYEATRQCKLTDPNDPIFKKKFGVSRFAKQFKGLAIESEKFYEDYLYTNFLIFVEALDRPYLGRDVVEIHDCLKFLLSW